MLPVTLGVVGSRTFRNYPLLKRELDKLRKTLKVSCIVSGGAQGADKMAERYARENTLELVVLKPEWRVNGVYDPKAGLNRNTQIIERADFVVAFWDGKSTGTADSMRKTRRLKGEASLLTIRTDKITPAVD